MGDALQHLFREVADLSPHERARYFDAQAVPQELRAEVESLIRFDTKSRVPLIDSVEDLAARLLGIEPDLAEGARCGPYVLVRLLGRGGMGSVFLAHRTDGEVEQRVAIKFVPNTTSSPAFRNRFLQERQILASLQHPGIARLLNAGHTAGGHPYFAMEYVDGTAIDVYADPLQLPEKLGLFLRVCDAVSYAHRCLVIHRDIKPSNILVDSSGQPKLLDFGIARMLDDAADRALTRERLLTPEYASPEQVGGAAHTTATDVYSLGAVLYRLLTGRSPHEPGAESAETIETVICSREPLAPSRVNQLIPRDLDFVVLKALRKEADERYPSIDAFAEDVRAFLESRPVSARSASAWYWTRKFVRRRWLPVLAVAAVMTSLSVGVYVANSQRRIAERRFGQLRQLATKLIAVDAAVRNLPGSTSARQQMVAASMEYLDGLGREAYQDRDLMMELAHGYVALAQVQGVPVRPNLGQFAEAAQSLRKADGFLQRVLAEDRGRPDVLLTAAELEQDLMILADSQHHDEEALAHTERCGDYLDALLGGGRASPAQVQDALPILGNVGLSYMNRHQSDEAIRYDRRAVALARSGADVIRLATGLSLLANALRFSGDLEAALPPITEARQLVERYAYPNELLRALGEYPILMRQGQILGADEGISLNRPEQAIEPLQKAFDLTEQQAAADPNDATTRGRVATAARQLADIIRHRDPPKALAIYDRAIQRQREVKSNALARRDEARLLVQSSYPLRSLKRGREARARIDAAFELLRATGDYPAPKLEADREAAAALGALADLQAEAGDTARAVGTYRELLDKVIAARPDAEHDLRQANDLARIYLALARLLSRAGQVQEAGILNTRRLDLWRAWDRRLPNNPFVLGQLQLGLDDAR
jgi:tetratricopeptide (TPR) repeat protein